MLRMDTQDKTISRVRVQKLRAAIRREGKASEFARKYGLDATYLSQLMRGHRNFGEKSARNIEDAVGWPAGYLDEEDIAPEQQAVRDLAAKLTPEQCRSILPLIEQLARH